jgi:predicted enzyme related to lactoylglutathione lyase
MKIKRFAQLDIVTSDLADAVSSYQKNFEFDVQRTDNAEEAMIELGDAQIKLRSGIAVQDVISSSGDGLAAIWLEADDVEDLVRKLTSIGIVASPMRTEGDRRIIAINPASANMVPLFIFDRR